jgi:hypothetical protein
MGKLQDLPRIADQALGGLQADSSMKAQIIWKASRMTQPEPSRNFHFRTVAFVCACLIVFACFGFSSEFFGQDPTVPVIASQSAGNLDDAQRIASSNLDQSEVTIHASAGGSNMGIWAKWSDGSYPVIGIRGKFYRQLSSGISKGRVPLSSELGEIDTFSSDPSLASTDLIISNAVPVGAKVYSVSGMGGTLCAVEADDGIALFQRVSYSGHALRSNEQLKDTLQVSGHVVKMELKGTGTITEPAVCDSLLQTLFSTATLDSNGSLHADSYLVMTLDSGIRLQLVCNQERVAACGVWSSPEFFDAFQDALGT